MKRLFTIIALMFAMYTFGQINCVADFTYTIDTNANLISFQDTSWSYDSLSGQATPISWDWQIQGTSYSTSSVNYTYTSLPVYVCLSVEFDNGCTNTKCDTIDLTTPDPCEGFYAYDDYDVVTLGMCTGELTGSVHAGTAPFTYSWSTGANTQTITDLCEGSYYYTVTDANGCTAINSGYVAEDDSSNIQITDSLYNSAIDTCLDFTPIDVYVSNVTIIDSLTLEVEWTFTDSIQTQIVTETYGFYGAYGSYYVLISIDCGAKTVQTWGDVIVIDEYTATGIKEVETLNNLKLYPNPVKDVLNLEFNTIETDVINIQVMTYTGQIISNVNINSYAGKNSVSISTNDLNSGIYFVRINNKTIKFVK